MSKSRKIGVLAPKLAIVCLGGWAMALFASVEVPSSVKLIQIENRIDSNEKRIQYNNKSIAQLQQIHNTTN